MKPSAVLQRRLRQAAQATEDLSQRHWGKRASSSGSGAQGDLEQRRKKRRNKIELKEDLYVQYEPPSSGAAAKKEPEPQSDDEVVDPAFLQEQLRMNSESAEGKY